jgi:hypothetical protein
LSEVVRHGCLYGQDYTPLIKAIERYTHIKALKSAYFIDSPQDAAPIRDALMKLIDGNDTLFVMELKNRWGANRHTVATEWLQNPSRTWR